MEPIPQLEEGDGEDRNLQQQPTLEWSGVNPAPQDLLDDAGREIVASWRTVVPPKKGSKQPGQVRFAPNIFDPALTAAWMDRLTASNIWDRPMDAEGRLLRRQTAWVTPEGCSCAYCYGSADRRAAVIPQFFLVG